MLCHWKWPFASCIPRISGICTNFLKLFKFLVNALSDFLILDVPGSFKFCLQIAKKGQSAAYVSISSNAGMAAMMGFAQISLLYEVNKNASFLLAGLVSVANFFVLGSIGFVVNNMIVTEKTPTVLKTKSQLELFFGEVIILISFLAYLVSFERSNLKYVSDVR